MTSRFQAAYDRSTLWFHYAASADDAGVRLSPGDIVTMRRCLVVHDELRGWHGWVRAQVRSPPLPKDLKVELPELFLLAAYVHCQIQDLPPGEFDEAGRRDMHESFMPELLQVWPAFRDELLAFLTANYRSTPIASNCWTELDYGPTWAGATMPPGITEDEVDVIEEQVTDLFEMYEAVDTYAGRVRRWYPDAPPYNRPQLFIIEADDHDFSYAAAMLLVQWSRALVLTVTWLAAGNRATFALTPLQQQEQAEHRLRHLYYLQEFNETLKDIRMFPDEPDRTDYIVWRLHAAYEHEEGSHRDFLTAFALGRQKGAGADSHVRGLGDDLIQHILKMTV